MTLHTYYFSNEEVADLVRAITFAQDEVLYMSLSFPEMVEQNRRWVALLKVLQDDKAHA